VKVLDARGNPVPGQQVSFVVTGGGGSLFSSGSTTTDLGTASDLWKLGQQASSSQTAEARIVTAGGAGLVASFTASAKAGAVASLQLVSPASRILGLGDTAQISVTGKDSFGNSVSFAEMGLTFQSSSNAIASVSPTGVATALTAGMTDIAASAGNVRAITHIVVDGSVQTVYSTSGVYYVTGRGATPILMGTASDPATTVSLLSVGRWSGTGFTFDGPPVSGSFTQAWQAADGSIWASASLNCTSPSPCDSTSTTVWKSSGSGQWQRMNAVGQMMGFTVLSGADPDVVTYGTTAIFDRPFIFKWTGSAWQDLAVPQTTVDSAFQLVKPLVRSATEIYGFGPLEAKTNRYGGRYRAAAVVWDGSQWHFLSIPPPPSGTVVSVIIPPTSFAPGAPMRVLVASGISSYTQWQLLELSPTGVTELPFSLPSGVTSIDSYSVTPTGALLVVSSTVIAKQTPTGWNTVTLRNGWRSDSNSAWEGSDGLIWISAVRDGSGGAKERAIISIKPN
jgi:hypothetical protein